MYWCYILELVVLLIVDMISSNNKAGEDETNHLRL